ncbi:hypothetical protein N7478_001874 [Penicillium angulare]|uniref:uncharacterized protein n=1 Tax=Penicillium angulare TaxID=116970 RepID=UPI002541A1FD|nr:uncharacterized protein N7478_001874 [Penicillium angulare]KAJ5288844.1 hypothetical protein N7478_001874 [Penicillium angulare]
MPTKLSILVFVASPLDYARYRHTALYIEFDEEIHKENIITTGTTSANASLAINEESTHIKTAIMEVVGEPGFFTFSERLNWELPTSTNIAHVIPVATIDSSGLDMREIISKTRISNGDAETDWNSQNWVGDVLDRLVSAGLLDVEKKERGVDDMIEAVLEAADENYTG